MALLCIFIRLCSLIRWSIDSASLIFIPLSCKNLSCSSRVKEPRSRSREGDIFMFFASRYGANVTRTAAKNVKPIVIYSDISGFEFPGCQRARIIEPMNASQHIIIPFFVITYLLLCTTRCISRPARRPKLKPKHASTLVGWMLVLCVSFFYCFWMRDMSKTYEPSPTKSKPEPTPGEIAKLYFMPNSLTTAS